MQRRFCFQNSLDFVNITTPAFCDFWFRSGVLVHLLPGFEGRISCQSLHVTMATLLTRFLCSRTTNTTSLLCKLIFSGPNFILILCASFILLVIKKGAIVGRRDTNPGPSKVGYGRVIPYLISRPCCQWKFLLTERQCQADATTLLLLDIIDPDSCSVVCTRLTGASWSFRFNQSDH